MNLRTEEAALTGESLPVDKTDLPLASGPLAAGDRLNMVHAGTTVASGRAEALVVATGMQTDFGRTAGMLGTVAAGPTPLQRNLDRLGVVLGRAAHGPASCAGATADGRGNTGEYLGHPHGQDRHAHA